MAPLLAPDTFLAIAEMVAAQLRIKEADRWSPQICQLKYISFTSEFPEVSDQQFLWAAEKWLQSTAGEDFLRYPTWTELMSPLYRCENGLANREWGFKEELPALVAPTAEQLAMMPASPEPPLALPPVEGPTHHGLTKQIWQNYLKEVLDGP